MTRWRPQSLWALPLLAFACTILGLVVGRMIGGTEAPQIEPADEHAAHATVLAPATLRQLGIEVAPLELTDFVRSVAVAAVVVETPRTEQPVFAPIGGRVASIDVEPGTMLAPGRTVLTLVRDPLPRPELTFTADVLRPAQERLHEAVATLRRAAEERRIAATELERIEAFTGRVGAEDVPILPRQRAIDLRYELARTEEAFERARLELRKHGFSDEQVEDLAHGAGLPEFDERMWRRALEGNGLWPASAQRLSEALPPEQRRLPWVVATIGELAAMGLASEELALWLGEGAVAEHFLEFGVMLQRGHSLEDLRRLHALHAFEAIVRVEAPALPEVHGAPGGAGDPAWDVFEILTKAGEHVAAGQRLAMLHDMRRLLLRTDAVGGEVAALLAAARSKATFAGETLVRGAGPRLTDLEIAWIESDPESDGTVAFVLVANHVLSRIEREDGIARTWALRRGLRYLLDVPLERLSNVYVLPAGAITQRGPDHVVYVQNGDQFEPVPVTIAHRDHRQVVIPVHQDVALFPGDRVVRQGAFELGLALQGSDAADPHAGHNH